MTKEYTSAGRLLTELNRIRAAYKNNQTVADVLPGVFSYGRMDWRLGAWQFERLIDRVRSDVQFAPEQRRPRYSESLDLISQLINPNNFSQTTHQHNQNIINDLTIERMEGFHDMLYASGKFFHIDDHAAETAIGLLDELANSLANSEETEFSKAILAQISLLRTAIKEYNLFGPEGLREAVSLLIGEALNTAYAGGPTLSSSTKKSLKSVFGVSKTILDIFVYSVTIGQGVEWAGNNIAGLISS